METASGMVKTRTTIMTVFPIPRMMTTTGTAFLMMMTITVIQMETVILTAQIRTMTTTVSLILKMMMTTVMAFLMMKRTTQRHLTRHLIPLLHLPHQPVSLVPAFQSLSKQ